MRLLFFFFLFIDIAIVISFLLQGVLCFFFTKSDSIIIININIINNSNQINQWVSSS
jgi:hypothetical protein